MSELATLLSRFVAGTPFGRTAFPKSDAPGLPSTPAAQAAFARLGELIALLPFERRMTDGTAQRFRLTGDHFFMDQPPAAEEARLPTIARVGLGNGQHVPYGIGPAQDIEGTEDVFGEGTVLVRLSDYVESFALEVVAATDGVRDAIVAGLEQTFQMQEESLSLRLSLPRYYGQLATFVLQGTQLFQDADAARERRKAHLLVELTVTEVMLVNASTLRPTAQVDAT